MISERVLCFAIAYWNRHCITVEQPAVEGWRTFRVEWSPPWAGLVLRAMRRLHGMLTTVGL